MRREAAIDKRLLSSCVMKLWIQIWTTSDYLWSLGMAVKSLKERKMGHQHSPFLPTQTQMGSVLNYSSNIFNKQGKKPVEEENSPQMSSTEVKGGRKKNQKLDGKWMMDSGPGAFQLLIFQFPPTFKRPP